MLAKLPHIHRRYRSFSVSDALETIGNTLQDIREEDGLSWKDVGRVLNKSDDRASDYAKALSEMPVSAFLLGCREWNGRFANPVLALVNQKLGPVDATEAPDNEKLSRILALAHALSVALADDGVCDDGELRQIGPTILDEAARGIDALRDRLARLSLRSVA